ncbi:hypothetical protein C2E21_5162 [Chlorella sorokiniana]|uniref:Uncharacterized protein n=1 Tax=Chlorella sorokiniana TaxID=3076 RepID=A0A2P6TQG7_CHLSO|nr:hypothetical protein C2E21_5162 [Chlorella sorokiniana]|eukprot:PRW56276.1 hypothetical protein C2E21_5162 [Chlorella sorokiniana]
MGRHEDYWTDDEGDGWDQQREHGDGLSGAAAAWRRPRRNCPPPPPPLAADQLFAPPAIAVGPSGADSGGISASTFVSYVAMGFGGTVALIAICVCSFLVYRRLMQQRQERDRAAAAAQDPRRQQVENVQRMIDEKRKAAAVARKPFLVVHPGGDAVVAFKDAVKQAEEAEEGYIKSYHQPPAAGPGTAAVAAGSSGVAGGSSTAAGPSRGGGDSHGQQDVALMSRRALVAAAALSGRTTSGISDVVGDLSASNTPTAAGAELAMAAWGGSQRPANRHQQQIQQQQAQQQTQQQPGLQGHPSAASLSSQGSQRPLLGSLPGVLPSMASEPPPAHQRADDNV